MASLAPAGAKIVQHGAELRHHAADEGRRGLSVGVRIGHGHPQARRFKVLDRWQEVDKRHALAFDDRADLCRDVGERIGLQFAQLGNMEDDELGAEIAGHRGEAERASPVRAQPAASGW